MTLIRIACHRASLHTTVRPAQPGEREQIQSSDKVKMTSGVVRVRGFVIHLLITTRVISFCATFPSELAFCSLAPSFPCLFVHSTSHNPVPISNSTLRKPRLFRLPCRRRQANPPFNDLVHILCLVRLAMHVRKTAPFL